MKKSIILVFSIAFSLLATAQGSYDFGKQQAKIWRLAKQRTVAVAKAMPADKFNYQPTKQVKSFGQQFTHIANSMLSMNARFILNDTWPREKCKRHDQRSDYHGFRSCL